MSGIWRIDGLFVLLAGVCSLSLCSISMNFFVIMFSFSEFE